MITLCTTIIFKKKPLNGISFNIYFNWNSHKITYKYLYIGDKDRSLWWSLITDPPLNHALWPTSPWYPAKQVSLEILVERLRAIRTMTENNGFFLPLLCWESKYERTLSQHRNRIAGNQLMSSRLDQTWAKCGKYIYTNTQAHIRTQIQTFAFVNRKPNFVFSGLLWISKKVY